MKKKKKIDRKPGTTDESENSTTANRTSKKDLATEKQPVNEDLFSFKCLIFILSFAAYSSTCYRSLPGGDSTELIGNGSRFSPKVIRTQNRITLASLAPN